MAFIQDDARVADAPAEFGGFVPLQQDLLLEAIAIPSTDRVIHQEHAPTVRVDIGDAENKVRIWHFRADPYGCGDGPGDLERFFESICGPSAHIGLGLERACILCAGKTASWDGHRLGRVRWEWGGTGVRGGLFECEAAIRVEEERPGFVGWGPRGGGPPDVPRGTLFADCAHHVVAHGWIFHDAVRLVVEVVIEPTCHVVEFRPCGVVGVGEFVDLRAFVESAVQPRSDDQLLFASGFGGTEGLASCETLDATLDHEVVPTADGEAGDIHPVEVA